MAPAQKVGQTIVPLFTNRGGPPAPKVDKTIVPLFIGKNLDSPPPKIRGTPIVYCLSFRWKESQIIDNQSLKLKQQ